ncbi:hypothetical protein ACQKK5_26180, partial [Brevibacillus panacihumi]|uniref:hypothetical protein n=1 Tax=Brevibacillus panacihumi TaxID=497735 RepID=UPI003D072F23
MYDVNGNGVDQGLEERPNSIRVPAGGKIVVTGVTDSPSAIGSYYEFFEGIVSDKPALLRVSLNEGESYRFSNKADAQTRVLTNAASSNNIKFDYISYEPDGKTYSKDVGITGEYHHINIPIGGNTVVTNVSEYPILFGGYFEFLDGETSSEQALWRISIAKGENYTITNTSNKNQILVNDSYQDGRMFDYVIKNADGSVKSSRVNYRATRVISLIENKIEIPAGGQLHVTGVEDTPAVIGGESLYFSGETSSNPALLKVIANKGENYQFTNKTHSNINIVSNGLSGSSNPRLFDFAIYNSDKSGKDLKIEASDASLQVPAGGEIVITGASDMPVTVGAPFGFFEVENSTSPALYKREVAANETATFTNINNFDTTIKTDASSGREIDYQTYNESGALVIQRENSTTKSITVPRKGKLIATVSGGGAVNFYGYFNHFLNIDSDGDGIPDWQEVRGIRIGYQGEYIKTVYTDPYNYDTDGDGIYDGAEVLELKYYNTGENFYEVIDDPSSTVNGSIIEDVLFEEPPFYDYESDDLQTIKSILLALEEYKDNCNRQVVLNTFCSLRLNTFFSENRAPVFDSVA